MIRNGVVKAAMAAVIAFPAWAASNDLDNTFNQSGSVNLASEGVTLVRRVDVDVSGVQTVFANCGTDFCILRYNADGSPKTDFATNGKLTVASATLDGAQVFAAFALSDKFWLLANGTTTGQRLKIARIKLDGSFDTEFDTDGKADLQLAGHDVQGRIAILDGAGRIYIAGIARVRDTDTRDSVFLSRLNNTGAVDASFYGSGKRFFELTSSGQPFNPVLDQLEFSTNGRLLLTVHSNDLTNNIGQVIRLNISGTFDTGFNTNGVREIAVDAADVTSLRAEAFSDERVLASASVTTDAAVNQIALQLYKTDGAFDTSFSSDGKDLSQPGGQSLHNARINWLPEARFVLSAFNDANQLVLTRFAADGTIVNSGADQWTVNSVSSLQRFYLLSGGKWLLASAASLTRLVGDDRSPAIFTIPRQDDVAINSSVSAAPIAITGLEQVAVASVVGSGALLVSTTNACSTSSTYASSVLIKNGEYLCVKMDTAKEYEKETTLTVYVGDYNTTFVNKTRVAPSGGGGGGGAMWPLALIGLWFFRKRQR